MNKIKVLVAHQNEKIKNEIVDSVKTLNFAELVGTAENGIETYNKIVELKPEMAFIEFNLENMNGLEIIKKSKETLESQLPVFSIIDKIEDTELKQIIEIGGDNIIPSIQAPHYRERTIDILNEYNDDRNS